MPKRFIFSSFSHPEFIKSRHKVFVCVLFFGVKLESGLTRLNPEYSIIDDEFVDF